MIEIRIINLKWVREAYQKDKDNKKNQWVMFLEDPNSKEVKEIMEKIEDVKKAEKVLEYIVKETPLQESKELSVKLNANVFYKWENLQKTGTFYIRGACNKIANLTDDEKEILTDAAKIFVLKGKDVALVDGDVTNIKITYPYDLKLANTILND